MTNQTLPVLARVPQKKRIRILMLAVAMTALVMSTARAEDAPRLHTDVTLTGDVLTVGDLFPGVHDAGHVLAPAPLPGKTLVLTTRDIKRVSDAFSLGWEATAPVSVTVRRDGKIIDRNDVEAMVADELKTRLPGQNFEVALNDKNFTLALSRDTATELQLRDLKTDIASSSFTAQLVAPTGLRKDIAGRLTTLVSVPVLGRAISQGETITASDLQYIDVRSDDLKSSTIVDAQKIIGQTPRRLIQAMRQVAAVDLMPPAAVKKGQVVTMLLTSGQLQLTAQGKALETGAVGDVVRVANTASQQVIQAVVSGDRTVTIGAAPVSDVQAAAQTVDNKI